MPTIGNQAVRLGLGLRAYMPPQKTVELAKYAEGAGFEHLWCSNEKLNRDMWVMLGLLAASTQSATLGPFVADPYTYHPVLIASACATLEETIPNRTILLLGAGGTGFKEMGIQRVSPLVALEESVNIIRGLFRGETVTLPGKIMTVKNAHLHYAARPDLPIWIASRGNRVLKLAGQIADGVMIATYAEPTGMRHALELVRAGCAAGGRSPDEVTVTVRVDVCIDTDSRRARDAVKPTIANVIRTSHPDQAFVRQAGLAVPDKLAAMLEQGNSAALTAEIQSSARELVPDEFVDAFAWAGTPDDVAARVRAVLGAGFTNVCIVPIAPPGGSVEGVVRAFAEQVVPRLTP